MNQSHSNGEPDASKIAQHLSPTKLGMLAPSPIVTRRTRTDSTWVMVYAFYLVYGAVRVVTWPWNCNRHFSTDPLWPSRTRRYPAKWNTFASPKDTVSSRPTTAIRTRSFTYPSKSVSYLFWRRSISLPWPLLVFSVSKENTYRCPAIKCAIACVRYRRNWKSAKLCTWKSSI